MKCPEKPRKEELHSDSITNTYEIQVITPIFGGGVEAGVNDPITPIRPSSIRGHLRFWWRATRGASCDSVKELKQREGEIWGTTENPSPVEIEVTMWSYTEPVECAHYKERDGRKGFDLRWSSQLNVGGRSLPYALFPFQGTAPNSKDRKFPAKMICSARFSLKVVIANENHMYRLRADYNGQRAKKGLSLLGDSDDDIKRDVESAVWAWINFGGIGARTRRGCGALYCLHCKPEDPELMPQSFETFKDWMTNRMSKYGLKYHTSTNDWPTIGEIRLKIGLNAISCWETSIEVLKDLRQGANIGRDSGHGRSRWPEAESVRELVLKTNDLKSRPSWHDKDPRIPIIAFPRAEFGMPIIIEIRKESLTPGGVNIKPTLQRDEKNDRMASPLILRPIKFRDSKFASMIIRLNKTTLDSAYLKPGNSDLAKPQPLMGSQITDAKLAHYKDSPMNRGLRTGSAVDAFLAYAKENGFVPVFP